MNGQHPNTKEQKYRVECQINGAGGTREMNGKMIAEWEMRNTKLKHTISNFKWNLCVLSFFFHQLNESMNNMNVWSTVQTEVRFKLLCLHPEQNMNMTIEFCVARLTITNDAICVLINTFDFPLFAYKIGEWMFVFFSFSFSRIDESLWMNAFRFLFPSLSISLSALPLEMRESSARHLLATFGMHDFIIYCIQWVKAVDEYDSTGFF